MSLAAGDVASMLWMALRMMHWTNTKQSYMVLHHFASFQVAARKNQEQEVLAVQHPQRQKAAATKKLFDVFQAQVLPMYTTLESSRGFTRVLSDTSHA